MKLLQLDYFKFSEEQKKKRIGTFHIKKDARVLDLGCSDGVNSALLYDLGVSHIVGIDKSRKFIKEAKKNYPHIAFYTGFAEKLPFPKESFDVVFVDSVFHHIKNYKKVVSEVKRILVAGGLLCFVEPHASFGRKIIDSLTISKISRFIPLLKERRKHYFKEKTLMEKWLKEEKIFLKILGEYEFKQRFYRRDTLSIVGQYEKIRDY